MAGHITEFSLAALKQLTRKRKGDVPGRLKKELINSIECYRFNSVTGKRRPGERIPGV